MTVLDLNDFEMPIYSVDKEREDGIPSLATEFKEHINATDGIVISFAEHNGAYSVAFKNIMDWISRMDKSTWADKPMFLMATSPRGRGGSTVLEIAVSKFKYMTSWNISSFSLPSFMANFDDETRITDGELLSSFRAQLAIFADTL